MVTTSPRDATPTLHDACAATSAALDPAAPRWVLSGRALCLSRPVVVGILNVTPDSFSDGGRFLELDAALRHADQMESEGAAMIDVGAVSTRPGAVWVSEDEEGQRLFPLLRALRASTTLPIAVDTWRSTIAERALELGVEAINDISGGRFDVAMGPLVAARRAGFVVCHSDASWEGLHDVRALEPEQVVLQLRRRRDALLDAGVRAEQLVVDPGFGFGKDVTQNLRLLRQLTKLQALDLPLYVGGSRKRFVRAAVGTERDSVEHATTAFHTLALEAGARILRTHNVSAAVACVAFWSSTREAATSTPAPLSVP